MDRIFSHLSALSRDGFFAAWRQREYLLRYLDLLGIRCLMAKPATSERLLEVVRVERYRRPEKLGSFRPIDQKCREEAKPFLGKMTTIILGDTRCGNSA
jgi:hypothetical protein